MPIFGGATRKMTQDDQVLEKWSTKHTKPPPNQDPTYIGS